MLHRSPTALTRLIVLMVAVLLGGCASDDESTTRDTSSHTAPDTEAGTGPTTTSPPAPEPADACEGLQVVSESPVRTDPPLTEISGAVASERTPGAFWVHEDSANPTVLVEIDSDGHQVSRWDVPGVEMVDWEDIAALVDEDGTRHLFIGDIGDNLHRRESTQLLRLPEPGPDDVPGATAVPQIIELRSPLGPADAEALLLDPLSGDLVVVTKSVRGMGEVLVAPGGAWAGDGAVLDLVHAGTLELGPVEAVLAGDVAADGRLVAVRTPARVLLWERHPDDDLATTLLERSRCRGPSRFDIFGEALAFTNDGYVFLGEGDPTDLVVVR